MASWLKRALPVLGWVAALTFVGVAFVAFGIVRWAGIGTFVLRFTFFWAIIGTPVVVALAGPRVPPSPWKRTILWSAQWAVGGAVIAWLLLNSAAGFV